MMKLVLLISCYLLALTNGQPPSGWTQDVYSPLTSPGIPENTQIGAVIGTMVANKQALGNDVVYSTTSTVFSVDSQSGIVTLKTALNYYVQPTFTVTFYATFGGASQISDSIVVNVLPVNHPPVFSSPSYETAISENAKIGATVTVYNGITVTDQDHGSNGSVTVTCIPSAECNLFIAALSPSTNGQVQVNVILQQELTYQNQQVHMLQLLAQDGGTPPLTATANLTIYVENANPNLPVFQNIPLNFNVPTGSPTGTSVGSIIVNSSSAVLLTINSDPQGFFSLGKTTSSSSGVYTATVLTTANLAAYTRPYPNYNLIIEAVVLTSNGSQTSTFTVTPVLVQITSSTHMLTITATPSNTAYVAEGVVTGSAVPALTLIVTDQNFVQGSNVFFTLTATIPSTSTAPVNTFGVSPSLAQGTVSASILVLRPEQLVYEDPTRQTFTVTVTAVSNYTNPYTATATVTINVLNPNNQPTPFQFSNYYATVYDNTTNIGGTVTQVSVGSTSGSGVIYGLVSGTNSQYFMVIHSTGEVKLAQAISAQTVSLVTLTVSATNSFGIKSYATVFVSVLSFSSQVPVFYSPQYVTTVWENTITFIPPIILSVKTIRSDHIPQYSIVGGNVGNVFGLINTTDPRLPATSNMAANLTMFSPVGYYDTPNKQGYYILTVQVTDDSLAQSALATNTTVIVNILDTNDHPPVFNSPVYFANVTEITPCGTPLLALNATDLDVGAAATISYVVGNGGKDNFAVNYNSGSFGLSSICNLSIETFGSQYNVTVYAVGHGNPVATGTATVYISVAPSVYRQPVFGQNAYSFTILDSTIVGSNVGAVQATDPDITAKFLYMILPGSITATDTHGQPVTNASGSYNYLNLFSVNSSTGYINIAQPLNRSYAAQVNFAVMTNISNPSINPTTNSPVVIPLTYTNVTIYIITQSTIQSATYIYAPTLINNMYNTTIIEQEPAGTPITQFLAYGGNQYVHNFQILSSTDTSGYITISSTTGILSVSKIIYYNSLPASKTLTYLIQATSPSLSSTTATANIVVQSLTPNVPSFQFSNYTFSVYRNATIGTLIGFVFATLSGPGSFSYSLISSNQYFAINASTGAITLISSILNVPVALFPMTATTVDNNNPPVLQPASASVLVKVIEVNSLPLIFTLPSGYSANLTNSDTANTNVAAIQATDPNLIPTKITYSIVGGNSYGYFSIDPTLGNVQTTTNVPSGIYHLNISATNDGNPPMTAYTTLTVTIANSTAGYNPIFTSPSNGATLSVIEGIPNAIITTVQAYSNRAGSPIITYGIPNIATNQAALPMFNLNISTGLLTTNGAMNRSVQSQYTIVIQALDNYQPADVSTISITINVYSSQPPTFSQCYANFSNPVYIAYTTELQPTGTNVTQMVACSFNIYPFIYYFITGGDGPYNGGGNGTAPPFAINNVTGEIYTTNILHWLYTPLITINVTVTNGTVSPQTMQNYPGATAQVNIYVVGTDFYPPSFDSGASTIYSFCNGIGLSANASILDITGYGVQIIQMYAGSCNAPNFRNFVYSITALSFNGPNGAASQSASGAFSIDPASGWVTTQQNSYRTYTAGSFTMTITATDQMGRTATSTLTIYVVQENQRLRFVFSNGPKTITPIVGPFVQNLNGVLQTQDGSNTVMIYDILRLHVDSSANLWFNESDMCFHVIQNQQVLNIPQAQALFINLPSNTSVIYNSSMVMQNPDGTYTPQPCNIHVTTRWWSGYWFLWWLLIALALFIFVVALILIICICIYYPRQKQHYFASRPYVVLDPPQNMAPSEFEYQSQVHKFQ